MTTTAIDLCQGLNDIRLSDLDRAAQTLDEPTETIRQAVHVFNQARQGNLRNACHNNGYDPDLIHNLYTEAIHHAHRKEDTTNTD